MVDALGTNSYWLPLEGAWLRSWKQQGFESYTPTEVLILRESTQIHTCQPYQIIQESPELGFYSVFSFSPQICQVANLYFNTYSDWRLHPLSNLSARPYFWGRTSQSSMHSDCWMLCCYIPQFPSSSPISPTTFPLPSLHSPSLPLWVFF